MTHMRSRLALLSCVVGATAFSAPPRRAIGNVRDELPEAPRPLPPDADGALLRALSDAFEPAPVEVRTQAIEDLGLLGDRRALNALAQLCLDPNPTLARAAVRAIAAMRSIRAEEILANVVRHPNLPETTKLKAIELLPYQNTWTSIRFIYHVARSVPVTSVVLSARRLAAELPRGEVAPPAATPPLSLPLDPDAGIPTPAAPGDPGGTP